MNKPTGVASSDRHGVVIRLPTRPEWSAVSGAGGILLLLGFVVYVISFIRMSRTGNLHLLPREYCRLWTSTAAIGLMTGGVAAILWAAGRSSLQSHAFLEVWLGLLVPFFFVYWLDRPIVSKECIELCSTNKIHLNLPVNWVTVYSKKDPSTGGTVLDTEPRARMNAYLSWSAPSAQRGRLIERRTLPIGDVEMRREDHRNQTAFNRFANAVPSDVVTVSPVCYHNDFTIDFGMPAAGEKEMRPLIWELLQSVRCGDK